MAWIAGAALSTLAWAWVSVHLLGVRATAYDARSSIMLLLWSGVLFGAITYTGFSLAVHGQARVPSALGGFVSGLLAIPALAGTLHLGGMLMPGVHSIWITGGIALAVGALSAWPLAASTRRAAGTDVDQASGGSS